MKVCILGSGAFGIALSKIANDNKNDVILWSHTKENSDLLDKKRISNKLPNYKIPKSIKITNNLKESINGTDLVVIAVPAFAFEEVIKELKKYIKKETSILIATKGIQQDSCLFLHDVLKKYLKNTIAVISGPTFASDIISKSPIGFSMGTKSKKTEILVKKCFENETTKFRVTRDITGIEICGSIKNVMAIASGMLEGMGITDSTKSLFLTESMNDIKELINALGGKKKTILSFAGFGDILMTCTSKTSRNFSFGYLIGVGSSSKEIDEYLSHTTVEGMYTLKSIHKLVRKKKVEIPIINLIYDIINGTKEKEEILKFLIEK